jgi:tagatose 1,6-diphosphate aldolase
LLSFLFRRSLFHNAGPLVDGELELVPPQLRWADEVLEACRHPLTLRDAPYDARLTRGQLEQFLSAAPLGHEPGDPSRNKAPTYHFWMMLRHGPLGPGDPPPLRIAGGVGLRIGTWPTLERYYGHLGYHVYPPARGHHYAERACRLLLPLARRHSLRPLWITCNPDNIASRRTCERLGGRLIDIVSVPPQDPLHQRGETEKCRYRLDI